MTQMSNEHKYDLKTDNEDTTNSEQSKINDFDAVNRIANVVSPIDVDLSTKIDDEMHRETSTNNNASSCDTLTENSGEILNIGRKESGFKAILTEEEKSFSPPTHLNASTESKRWAPNGNIVNYGSATDFRHANEQEEGSGVKDDIKDCSIKGSPEYSIYSDRLSNESTINEMRKNIVKEMFIDSEQHRKAIKEATIQVHDTCEMKKSAIKDQPIKRKVRQSKGYRCQKLRTYGDIFEYYRRRKVLPNLKYSVETENASYGKVCSNKVRMPNVVEKNNYSRSHKGVDEHGTIKYKPKNCVSVSIQVDMPSAVSLYNFPRTRRTQVAPYAYSRSKKQKDSVSKSQDPGTKENEAETDCLRPLRHEKRPGKGYESKTKVKEELPKTKFEKDVKHDTSNYVDPAAETNASNASSNTSTADGRAPNSFSDSLQVTRTRQVVDYRYPKYSKKQNESILSSLHTAAKGTGTEKDGLIHVLHKEDQPKNNMSKTAKEKCKMSTNAMGIVDVSSSCVKYYEVGRNTKRSSNNLPNTHAGQVVDYKHNKSRKHLLLDSEEPATKRKKEKCTTIPLLHQQKPKNNKKVKSAVKNKDYTKTPHEKDKQSMSNSCSASIGGSRTIDSFASVLPRTRIRKTIDYRRLSNEGVTLTVENSATSKAKHKKPKNSDQRSHRHCAEDIKRRIVKVANHKSQLSAKTADKKGHTTSLYRNNKKEERWIRALQGNISPPSDAENIDFDAIVEHDAEYVNTSKLSMYDDLPDLDDNWSHPDNPNTDNTSDTKGIRPLEEPIIIRSKSASPCHKMERSQCAGICVKERDTCQHKGAGNLIPIRKPGASASFDANLSKLIENSSSVKEAVKNQRVNDTLQGKLGIKRKKRQTKFGVQGALHKRKKSNSLDTLNQHPTQENQYSVQHIDHEEAYRQRYPVSNAEILKFFSSEEAALYLEKVFNKEVQSDRHEIVCRMFKSGKLDFGIHSKIFHLSQVQFLEDDRRIDSQLSDVMSRIFERVDISQVPEMYKMDNDDFDSQASLYRHKYIFHVLVPEGIVKYLQEKNGWDKKTAEFFYLDGESRVTNYELQQFDQELDEDAKREQERKLRERYDSEESEDGTSCNYDNNVQMLELPNLEPEKNDGGNEIDVISVSKKNKNKNKKGGKK